MIILGIICLIIIALDVISTPLKYTHDRVPRPAWKKSYASKFAALSITIDATLATFVLLVLWRYL